MRPKESPFLIWFSSQELKESLWYSYRLHAAPDHKPLSSKEELMGMARLFKRFLKKLEYLSFKDQDEAQVPLGKQADRRLRVPIDKFEELRALYLREHPQLNEEEVMLEELFFWYKQEIRAGRVFHEELKTMSPAP